MNFLLVLGDEAQLTASYFLYLSWDFYVLFIRLSCTASNLWPYLCRFDRIWSSNGGFPLDLHLMLQSVRSCWLHSSVSPSLRVWYVNGSTMHTVSCPRCGKPSPFPIDYWVFFYCLHLNIYCRGFVLLWYGFCVYGACVLFLALFKGYLRGSFPTSNFDFPLFVCWLLLMSLPSPTSPLSFSSSLDGSVDNQNNVPSPDHPSQSGVSALLDGDRSDHIGQPSISKPPSFSSILKFGVGSNSGAEMPPSEPKLRSQLRENQPTGRIPVNLPDAGPPQGASPYLGQEP